MTAVHALTWSEVMVDAVRVWKHVNGISVYGVPTGGSVVAALLVSCGAHLLNEPQPGCLVLDDLIETGRTLRPYFEQGYPVLAVYAKPGAPLEMLAYPPLQLGPEWVQFPWEHSATPEDAAARILEYAQVEVGPRSLADWADTLAVYARHNAGFHVA